MTSNIPLSLCILSSSFWDDLQNFPTQDDKQAGSAEPGLGLRLSVRLHVALHPGVFLTCPGHSQITRVKKINTPVIWSEGVHPSPCSVLLPALSTDHNGHGIAITHSEHVPGKPAVELSPTPWPGWTHTPAHPLPQEEVTEDRGRKVPCFVEESSGCQNS